jgi:DNA-binding transcriptional ArsR family regulator
MSKEEEFLQAYFTNQYAPTMTQEQFQMAMISLVEKGLMEVVEQGGNRLYRPTTLLKQIKSHYNSNPKNQN